MAALVDRPLIFAGVAFALMLLAFFAGSWLRKRRAIDEESRPDFDLVQGSILTMLALLVGFSFSMGIGRYDLRKSMEEAEANAIGTEYLRVDFLQEEDALKAKALLKLYLRERILFHEANDRLVHEQNVIRTTSLQNELWAVIKRSVTQTPTPVQAQVMTGMNDTLNSQSYTQAAWLNKIPLEAWYLMLMVALIANFLVGLGSHGKKLVGARMLILPFILAVAFLSIADMDSPVYGLIRVSPQNLLLLEQTL